MSLRPYPYKTLTITLDQVVEWTGIGKNTIGDALRSGTLAGFKVGSSGRGPWRTTEADVRKWFRRWQRRDQPRAEPMEEGRR